MPTQYNIAIIGPKDTILGFKALGLIPVPVLNSEEALEALKKLKEEKIEEGEETRPKYAIIFVIEDLAKAIPKDEYKKLSEDVLPAIIPISGSKGSTGFGLTRISRMVEQAVGSDIFNK